MARKRMPFVYKKGPLFMTNPSHKERALLAKRRHSRKEKAFSQREGIL
jgi:hypothetical protein